MLHLRIYSVEIYDKRACLFAFVVTLGYTETISSGHCTWLELLRLPHRIASISCNTKRWSIRNHMRDLTAITYERILVQVVIILENWEAMVSVSLREIAVTRW